MSRCSFSDAHSVIFASSNVYAFFLFASFYADDFDDFCSRASELAEKANGAPLFTVVQSIEPSKQMYKQDDGLGCSGSSMANDDDLDSSGEAGEEWQIL